MAQFEHGYAVVIGIGADLPITVADATAIATQLRDPARCAYPEDHVRLLTSENARRSNILSALEWLADSCGPNDTAIVYFSGHGIETPGFHLIPFGFDWNNISDTAISEQEFTQHLHAIKAQKLVVLLDCCHAGGQAEAKKYPYPKSPLPSTVIHEFEKSSGRVVIASSRKDELSWIGTTYSEFTIAVLEALAGYGAFENDGYARVLDLTLWVGRVVPERTADKQHPIVKVSNLQDNFALAWYAGGNSKPKNLPWQVGVPQIDHGLNTAQVATWRKMLANHRSSLLLIEERMSQFVEFTTVPLQLEQSRRFTEAKITELENRLGLNK